jgi:hypothetical protein
VHESGQPFRKTVVRIPGPSFRANRITLKMMPLETDSDWEEQLIAARKGVFRTSIFVEVGESKGIDQLE